ncbi:hypothetical protein AVEN_30073-1 [Araneus ventricosus]|uniref:Cytochrome P450 18a1 n=1 Tax=Araneus ventricosus TaxID=182803 RepID=A0A4Y2UMV9_ARAVE|nr:hypothetical protein AVEN_30073-1 [Araneus ventricosus]
MEAITLIILALLVILISIWCLSWSKSSIKSIPGPWTNGLPIVGSLPFMTSRPFIKLTELGEKNGPIYRLKLGSVNVVVLTDFETIKEAFSKDALMGRPPDIPLEFTEETLRSEVMSTAKWNEQRRFSLHMLRDLGFGKTRMEEHIQHHPSLKEPIRQLEKYSRPFSKQQDNMDQCACWPWRKRESWPTGQRCSRERTTLPLYSTSRIFHQKYPAKLRAARVAKSMGSSSYRPPNLFNYTHERICDCPTGFRKMQFFSPKMDLLQPISTGSDSLMITSAAEEKLVWHCTMPQSACSLPHEYEEDKDKPLARMIEKSNF